MIKSLFLYMFRDYLRSYKYIVPILLFIVFLLGIYVDQPVDVLGSYIITSIFVYFISAWLALGFLDTEDNVQQQLTILHSGNQSIYYLCKIVFVWVITLLLSLIAVVYPILIHAFMRPIDSTDLLLGFLSHVTLGLLGTSIGCLFNTRLIRDRRLALLGLYLVIIISIIQGTLISAVPFLKYIIYLLPPVYFTMNNISTASNLKPIDLSSNIDILLYFGIIFLYLIALIFIFIKLMKKKAF
ncbi:MAG: hypothetical protein Q8920_07680 [Bacillota bacterium]|nr:hypothetical protein [Bacillota bacterium]